MTLVDAINKYPFKTNIRVYEGEEERELEYYEIYSKDMAEREVLSVSETPQSVIIKLK